MAEAISNVLSGKLQFANVNETNWLNQFTLEPIAQQYFDVIKSHII